MLLFEKIDIMEEAFASARPAALLLYVQGSWEKSAI